MNQSTRNLALGIWTTMVMCSTNAAEFSEADVIPAATSLLFTRTTIALSLEPYFTGGDEDTAQTLYFVADRSDYKFRQILLDDFVILTKNDHYRERTYSHGYAPRDYKVTNSEDCADSGYRSDSGRRDLTGRRTFQFELVSFEVRMHCRSSISDAILHNDELWIATYEQGDHGEYGAEGVLVVSNSGPTLTRIDVGNFPTENIVIDPWSSDVWIVTRSQLTQISKKREVKARYWKYHDFDSSRNQPDIFVVANEKEVSSNPLAVLAKWMGQSSYEGLSRAHKNGVKLSGNEPLYDFAMFGNYYSHYPQLPIELAVLLDSAEPTILWRRFACRSHGALAKELCGLELDAWPTRSNRNNK